VARLCLRARAPCPLRESRAGTDRAERAAQAAGVSVQCELQVHALLRSLGQDRTKEELQSPTECHAPGSKTEGKIENPPGVAKD
jgi:hypothetical protein